MAHKQKGTPVPPLDRYNSAISMKRKHPLTVHAFTSRHPAPIFWTATTLFAAANALLSYVSLSVSQTLWVVFLGFLLPLFPITLTPYPFASQNPLKIQTFPAISRWAWAGTVILAVFLRFYHLNSLSAWPTVDEGVHAYFSADLSRHWNGRLLVNASQFPAAYCWGQSLLFKWLSPSLFSLWLYPALWSTACLGIVGIAARRFFPASTAFFLLFFMAFGFWPLYLGRLSILGGCSLCLELLALALLAFYLEAPRDKRFIPLLSLTVLSGLGFYTYFTWPLVAALLGFTLLGRLGLQVRDKLRDFFFFGLGNLLFLFPLARAFYGKNRGYFQHVWVGSHPTIFLHNLSLAQSYIRQLFWGQPHTALCMGAVWGGLFNPVVSALGFTGLIILLKKPKTLWTLFWGAALLLFSSPAFLTTNLEMTRLSAILPIVLLIAAGGLQFLLTLIPRQRRMPVLLLVLSPSLALDLTQFLGVYPGHWRAHPEIYGSFKSVEYARAYAILKRKAEVDGPAPILLNEVPDPYDQTLSVAVAGFNSAWNPSLTVAPRWVALLANVQAAPYLSKRFPKGHWIWVSQGLNRPDGGFLLGVIDVTMKNQALLQRWTDADRALAPLVDRVMEAGVDPDQGAMLKTLRDAYPSFQGDPYLESVFWRIVAIHQAAAGHWRQAVADETQALQKGFPQAEIYNERGLLKLKTSDFQGARKDFIHAMECRPNHTDAELNLKFLASQPP